MRLCEIQPTAIKKPLTPAQSRLQALKSNIERARTALQAERDRQRQQREVERRRKQAFPISSSNTMKI